MQPAQDLNWRMQAPAVWQFRQLLIDKKSDESAFIQLAEKYALPMQFYPAEKLAQVPVPSPSAVVMINFFGHAFLDYFFAVE
jgi:hypothetical protein